MNKIFIPIKVDNGKKPGIWQIDVTELSLLQLIKLREELKKTNFTLTHTTIDKIIYNSMNEFRGTRKMYGNGFIKEEKRNKRNKSLKKIRRK